MDGQPIVKPVQSGFRKAALYFLLGVAVLYGIANLMAGNSMTGAGGSGEKIAIVEIAGFIGDSRDIVRQIRSFREDSSIQGIILRIDTPGGAVAPSQEIYDEVLRSRTKKPIYASMGSVAASGGYYIAAAAEKVYANPGSLTGSIGVIMAFTNFEGLMKKVGVRPEVIKAGKFKDTGSPARSMSKKEKKYLQAVVKDVHNQFIEAVTKGRNLTKKQARKLADGRIFTGRQALDLKMVDELGGLEDAISSMGTRLGIDGRPHVIQEMERETLMEWLVNNQIPDSLKTATLTPDFPRLQFLWTP
ncbi:MAG: signal peptide peptidase SppA [Candidatus Nitronauta litoralis]|uniref:Signal peptide peptidase SppA n=1 Tax=Candidatus Nitronauta litoralis TaxID=2705533 RepID=A0A7T0BVU4_9BACT|nr:MAG: signal peptide peptidase SppA [Candidatus Nitronauta litoralis]